MRVVNINLWRFTEEAERVYSRQKYFKHGWRTRISTRKRKVFVPSKQAQKRIMSELMPAHRLIRTCLKTDKVEVVYRSDSVLIQFFCPSLFMYKSSRRNGALYVGILNYNASQIVSFDRKLVTWNRKLEWSSLVNTWIKRVMAMLRHGVWQDNLVLSTDALTKD